MEDNVKQPSLLSGILALVFGGFGLLFLAILFVPLAIICALISTYKVIRGPRSTGLIVVTIIAWLLIILDIWTSPTIWAIFAAGAVS